MMKIKRKLKDYLRDYLRGVLLLYRVKLGCSRKEMAKRLGITLRSYTALECGTYCFSSLTLVRFLALLSDEEIVNIVRGFKAFLRKNSKKEAA